MTGRTDASGFEPFVRFEYVQLLQEGTLSVRMCSTDLGHLSRRRSDHTERISFSHRVKVAGKRIMEIRAERGNLLLRLNDYKVSNERL